MAGGEANREKRFGRVEGEVEEVGGQGEGAQCVQHWIQLAMRKEVRVMVVS